MSEEQEPPRAANTRLLAATEPKKLLDMPLPDLEANWKSLHEVRGRLAGPGYSTIECDIRLDQLRQAIELRRMEKQNADQHRESMGQGSRILFWAKIGGIAAAVGTIVLLLQEMPISKLLPSTSSQASPTSSPQMTVTAAPSQSPLATIQPSATPTATMTPSQAIPPPE